MTYVNKLGVSRCTLGSWRLQNRFGCKGTPTFQVLVGFLNDFNLVSNTQALDKHLVQCYSFYMYMYMYSTCMYYILFYYDAVSCRACGVRPQNIQATSYMAFTMQQQKLCSSRKANAATSATQTDVVHTVSAHFVLSPVEYPGGSVFTGYVCREKRHGYGELRGEIGTSIL